MKKQALALLLVLAIGFTAVSASLAWLSIFTVFRPQTPGSMQTGYFAGGTGTQDDPYLLTAPIHVYNLAWLQYMGYMNDTLTADGKIQQQYFKMVNDIDMAGMVIPPIGTREEPFVGNFDGNNCTVSNFTVSNVLGEGDIIKRPLSVTDLGDSASVVGFFGVIGDWDGTLAGKLSVDAADTPDNQKVSAVYNLFLDNFTVRTDTAKSLVGLLAGYVNGSVKNAGVGAATMQVPDTTGPLSPDVLGEGADENATALLEAINTLQAVSVYTLIGAYDLNGVQWMQIPEAAKNVLGFGEVGGEGSGFGGSMDMYSLIQRLTYMYTENVFKRPSVAASTPGPYPVVFTVGRSNSLMYTNRIDYNSTTAQTVYLNKNTVLPLNVDTQLMFESEKTYSFAASSSTSFDVLTTDYYEANTLEQILASNTGYIVGGGTDGSTTIIRARINKLASGTYPGLYRSLTTAKDASLTFSRENFQILTIDPTDNKLYVIDDDKNGNAASAVDGLSHKTYTDLNLTQYNTVVDAFSNTLTKGEGMIYGLRFYKGQNLDSNVATTSVSNAQISGTTYSSYELFDGAINFHLSGAGYITTLAGTYASQSGTHNMFTLYKLERNDDGTINVGASFAINQIWVKYDTNKKITDIQYNENASEATGYDCVYDVNTMGDLEEINAAYYFELPVTAGDYALTSLDGDNGAYLMYLDIGSNGDFNIGAGEGGTTEGEYTHAIHDVNFVSDANIAASTAAEADAGAVITYTLTVDATPHSGAQATFDRQSKTAMNDTFAQPGGSGSVSNMTLQHYADDASITYTYTPPAAAAYLSLAALAYLPPTSHREEELLGASLGYI